MNRTKISRLALLLEGMVVFRRLRDDPVIASFLNLLHKAGAQKIDLGETYRAYHHFCSIATEVHWPDYLWEWIIRDENELSQQVMKQGSKKIPPALRQLAGRDLLSCQEIAQLRGEEIKEIVVSEWAKQKPASQEEILQGEGWQDLWQEAPLTPESWPTWFSSQEACPQEENAAQNYLRSSQRMLKDVLRQGTSEEMVEALLTYYQRMGTGLFGQGMAFKWRGETGRLEEVSPDPMRISLLINQEREQGIILQNTEFFLSGYPANNIILYGNRGTGKSSLVKALLQKYYEQGLRLVELAKSDLLDYPKIIQLLAKQPALKFIIFIDDLSFEDTEADYKNLKTLLEGGLEGKPKNVLIYATSNRRNLVRETFGERQGDEVHRRDNMEEKLSLSDRFGITVTFPTPDQEGYLKIVEELAAHEGLILPREDLRQQALRWVMNHNARSGRTARQFIDFLVAKQGMMSQKDCR